MIITTCIYNRYRRKLAKKTKVEQTQNRNFYRHTFNSIFLLTRHSSVFQFMSWYWSTAKCRRRKSTDTWYNTVICATLCVNFLLKSKATNVFPKHILKSKAPDKSTQARRKMFCHVMVKNYLCNVLSKFLITFESTWRRKSKNKHPSWLYYTVLGLSEAASEGFL